MGSASRADQEIRNTLSSRTINTRPSQTSHYETTNYSLQNSDKVSVGFELSKNQVFYNTRWKRAISRPAFIMALPTSRSPASRSSTGRHRRLRDQFPQVQNPLNYSIVLQYGIKGTQVNQLVEQRYFNVTFSVNYRDIWYTKGRKYD